MDDSEIEVAEDARVSERVFNLMKNTDLENATFALLEGVGNPIHIENMNRQELFDLVLVNFARVAVAGEWDGLLTAGGGTTSVFNGELTKYDWDGDEDAVRVFALGPYGTTDRAILATCVQSEEIAFFAFIAPNSGVISSCDFYCNANSGASGAINVGFYADNEGVPETFLGEFVMATTSTGQITQTVSSGGTMGDSITTVRGTQYWIAFFGDNLASNPTFGTIQLVESGSGPFATSTYGSAAAWNCIFRTGSSGNATITDYTVLGPVSLDPINLGVKW